MRSRVVAVLCGLLLPFTLMACTGDGGGGGPLSLGGGVDTDPPETGACRQIEAEAIAEASDDAEPVACNEPHTAETYFVGEFTDADDLAWDDASLGAQVYRQCSRRYMRFVRANQSLALRSVVDWAWWRPNEEQWDEGARWYRCDVVGGRDQSTELADLPRTAKELLLGIPKPRWMLCAAGEVVADAPKVPCSQQHTWRAVSVVVVGKPKDKWPGSRLIEVKSRDFCSDWVGTWLSYPLDYEYGYTWFGRAEWEAGNRMSVCWARADR